MIPRVVDVVMAAHWLCGGGGGGGGGGGSFSGGDDEFTGTPEAGGRVSSLHIYTRTPVRSGLGIDSTCTAPPWMLPAAAHAIGFRRSGVGKGIIQPPGKHRRLRRLCRPLLLNSPPPPLLLFPASSPSPPSPSILRRRLLFTRLYCAKYVYMYIIKQSHTYRQHVYVTVTKAVDR